MCGDDHHRSHQFRPSASGSDGGYPSRDEDGPPVWETLPMPSAHVLSHLTDAHCHPTDLTHKPGVYDAVQLGGLASMATVVEDQDKVRALSEERGWYNPHDPDGQDRPKDDAEYSVLGRRGKNGKGVGVVACFGYHPWFTHLYTLSPPDALPTKEEHYTSLFLPSSSSSSSSSSKNRVLLENLLPYLPDPIPFAPLVNKLANDIRRSVYQGRLTMLGEVGLDGSARLRWPKSARHLHPESKCSSVSERAETEESIQNRHDPKTQSPSSSEIPEASAQTAGEGADAIPCVRDDGQGEEEEGEEWKRLTPFKVPISHQRAILHAQLEIAVELGVNVSFHSVAASGPSFDTLIKLRDKHRGKFTNRINVDIHSGGGWSPEFWKQAERNLQNLYASPSIFITSRSPSASALINSISPNRMLVESDSHDVRLSTRLVWAAAEWVSRIKGWKLEGRDDNGDGEKEEPWEFNADDEDDVVDKRGKVKPKPAEEIWTVRLLERNWATFMRLVDE